MRPGRMQDEVSSACRSARGVDRRGLMSRHKREHLRARVPPRCRSGSQARVLVTGLRAPACSVRRSAGFPFDPS